MLYLGTIFITQGNQIHFPLAHMYHLTMDETSSTIYVLSCTNTSLIQIEFILVFINQLETLNSSRICVKFPPKN